MNRLILNKWFRVVLVGGLAVCALVFAGDGPQNSARLYLKKVEARLIEATLQMDNKVSFDARSFFEQIILTSKDLRCELSPAQMLSNGETLSASSVFRCKNPVGAVKVTLQKWEALPSGFSVGIQTPFEHFSLVHDLPEKTTQLSAVHFFFWSGLELGASEKLQIGKPYVFSFGGLGIFPWGLWWIIFIGTIGATQISRRIKLIFIFLAPIVSGFITYLVLVQQASLRLIPAPRLEILFFTLSILLILGSFLRNRLWLNKVTGAAIACLIILTGLELSLILRWVEGNNSVPLSSSLSSFFLGLFLITALIAGLYSWLMLRKTAPGISLFSKLLLLLFNFYALLALTLQLI